MAFNKSFLQQIFKGLLSTVCLQGSRWGARGCRGWEFRILSLCGVYLWGRSVTSNGHRYRMGLALAMAVSGGPLTKSCALSYLTEISPQPYGVGLICFHSADEQTGSCKEQVAWPGSHSWQGMATPAVVSDSQVYRVNPLHMNELHSESTFITPVCS